MARNTISASDIVNEFMALREDDDFLASTSEYTINHYVLRGIREIGFDVSKVVRSIKISIDTTNNTVALPEDYVDMVKIGVVGSDGMVYVLGENKNINYSQTNGGSTTAPKITSESTDSKTATSGIGTSQEDDFSRYVFHNYFSGGGYGQLYGLGGGQRYGDYRINYDQNRIEIDTDGSISEVVLEYVADEAQSSNPSIHSYASEALRSYVYYKIIERRSNVPMGEKQRARKEYYNNLRLAKARLSNFTKEDALRVIRKNFKQSPKL